MKVPVPLPREDGKWVIRWRQNGSRPQRTFDTRKEASEFINRIWGKAREVRSIRNTGMVEETDISWIAGIMDCRGGWYFKSGGCLEFRMTSTDDALLRSMCDMLGSKLYDRKDRAYDRLACSQHCPEPHVHVGSNPGLDLIISGTRAAIVAFNVIPYLRVNDLECRAKYDSYMAEFSPWSPGGRKRTVNSMHLRGWEIPEKLAVNLDLGKAA